MRAKNIGLMGIIVIFYHYPTLCPHLQDMDVVSVES